MNVPQWAQELYEKQIVPTRSEGLDVKAVLLGKKQMEELGRLDPTIHCGDVALHLWGIPVVESRHFDDVISLITDSQGVGIEADEARHRLIGALGVHTCPACGQLFVE